MYKIKKGDIAMDVNLVKLCYTLVNIAFRNPIVKLVLSLHFVVNYLMNGKSPLRADSFR